MTRIILSPNPWLTLHALLTAVRALHGHVESTLVSEEDIQLRFWLGPTTEPVELQHADGHVQTVTPDPWGGEHTVIHIWNLGLGTYGGMSPERAARFPAFTFQP